MSGQFTESPSTPGTYWHGIHVIDNARNLIDERGAGLQPIQVSVCVCQADFNHSGLPLTRQDIFDILNAWFAGCA